jgi:hypothetical protein
VGYYSPNNTVAHGFLWDRSSGVYTTIDNPLAGNGATVLTGINNSGQMVGYYLGGWFLYDNGTFTPISHPNASEPSTFISGFNNNGQIFGGYFGGGFGVHLFFYDDGKYFDISLPLPENAARPDGQPAGNAGIASLGGMNDLGQFVGSYVRITEWGLHFGELEPTQYEFAHFIATPEKPDKKN